MEDSVPNQSEEENPPARLGAAPRSFLLLWELAALFALALGGWRVTDQGIPSDFFSLCWLLVGLHLWRILAVVGHAKPPPVWLLFFETVALLGWIDDRPWANPESVSVHPLIRLFHWRGGHSLGSQPLWSLIPALVVCGACLWRGARSSWLLSRRVTLASWTPRLLVGSGLLFVVAVFFGSSSQPWRQAPPPPGLERSATFSWRTGTRNTVLRGRSKGVWASAKWRDPTSPLLLRYRSEALSRPVARLVLVKGESTVVASEVELYETSPGLVRRLIEPPPALASGSELRLELHASNDPRFAGTLELAGLRSVSTSLAARAEQEGWVGALCSSPLAPCLLILGLLYLRSAWRGWRAPRSLGGLLLAAVVCGSWISLTVPALSLLFGWLALIPAVFLLGLQSWLVLLPFGEAIPPLLAFGPRLQYVLTGQLAPLFHRRPLSAGPKPEYLDRLESSLEVWTQAPAWLLALGVLALAATCVLSARAREGTDRPPSRRPSNYLFCLGALGYLLHPSWHLPIEPESQRALGLLLLGGLILLWRGLRWLEDRIPWSSSPPPVPWIDAGALVLICLYVLLRVPDLLLPPTFNSDEASLHGGAVHVFRAQHLSLGLGAGLGPRALVVGACLALALALRALAKRVAGFDRWLIGGLSAALLVWVLWLPIPEWSVMTTFRYPPLAKLIPGQLTWVGGESLGAARLWCLLAYVGAGYALFLGARRLGLTRAAAFGTLIFYLALNMTWYWSVFAYNTAFLVLFTAAASVPLLHWIRSANPDSLAWTGLWLACAGASRVTGIVSFGIMFLAIMATLLGSRRHRTRANALALGYLLCAVLPGAILWHKVLVGGWFSWVGRYVEWQHFKVILENYDRWRLSGHSFLNMNGAWACALVAFGVFVPCLGPSPRWRSRCARVCLLLGWLTTATIAPLLLGRASVWDGLPRFLLPSLLPAALLVGLGLDVAGRHFGRWAPLVLLAPLLVFGRVPVADQPAAIPTDLNPYVQYRGRSHGFFPESALLAVLPEGVGRLQAVVVHEADVSSGRISQLDPAKARSLETIDAEMKSKGYRVFILPYAPDPVLNDSLWRFQRVQPTLDPTLWQDPDSISASPLFRPVGVVTFHGVEFRLFERTGK